MCLSEFVSYSRKLTFLSWLYCTPFHDLSLKVSPTVIVTQGLFIQNGHHGLSQYGVPSFVFRDIWLKGTPFCPLAERQRLHWGCCACLWVLTCSPEPWKQQLCWRGKGGLGLWPRSQMGGLLFLWTQPSTNNRRWHAAVDQTKMECLL